MRIATKLSILVTALCLVGFTAAQEGQADPMAAMSPGEHHAEMEGLVGEWKATVKIWQAPGTEPVVSEGRTTYETALGGRYLQQSFEADMMGMPFEGIGISGFDNSRKKHTMMWIDNMGTAMMISENGSCSDDGKVTTHTTTRKSPMGGPDMHIKLVNRILSEDQHVFEYYVIDAEGGEFKAMEITYDRI